MFERFIKKAANTVNETIVMPIKVEAQKNMDETVKMGFTIGKVAIIGAIAIFMVSRHKTPSKEVLTETGKLISTATITINNYYYGTIPQTKQGI